MEKSEFEKGIEVVHQEYASDPVGDEPQKVDEMLYGSLTTEEKQIEKKLRLKIDLLVMPLVMLVYLMNHIDRNNYAAAKLQGLTEDLHLSAEQYSTGLSILFVGYVLTQVPSNAMLNYCGRPSIYLGSFVVIWGLVSLLTSQVTNYGGVVACRFILGFVEAPFFAGVMFHLSKWYTKSELNLRVALFYSASLIAGAFGNLIAAGILHGLAGARGLAAWQWLYIIEGAITIVAGIIVFLVLPDFPENWSMLTPEMKRVANKRMSLDATAYDSDNGGAMSQIEGIKAAFSDPKLYLVALGCHGAVGAAGIQNVYPTLLQPLHFSNVITLLLVAPPYIFIAIYSCFHGIMSDRANNRVWYFIYPAPFAILGCLLFMFTSPLGSRYFSFFLMNFSFLIVGTAYAWAVDLMPRPPAKRAAALAFINSVANASSIWTPYLYQPSTAPYYRLAMGVNVGLLAMSIVCALTIEFVVKPYEARKLRRAALNDAASL